MAREGEREVAREGRREKREEEERVGRRKEKEWGRYILMHAKHVKTRRRIINHPVFLQNTHRTAPAAAARQSKKKTQSSRLDHESCFQKKKKKFSFSYCIVLFRLALPYHIKVRTCRRPSSVQYNHQSIPYAHPMPFPHCPSKSS